MASGAQALDVRRLIVPWVSVLVVPNHSGLIGRNPTSIAWPYREGFPGSAPGCLGLYVIALPVPMCFALRGLATIEFVRPRFQPWRPFGGLCQSEASFRTVFRLRMP